MKKWIVCALLLVPCLILPILFAETETTGDYLRVHIRANSNGEEDQEVKYLVRDAVVEYLTPTVAECFTKQEAMEKIKKNLNGVARIAEGVLRENGYAYGAAAEVKREEFPTRVYDGYTLEAGVYDSLIIRLGAGTGDNWWCVVYPPLCFTGAAGDVTYKSKILEIIRDFRERTKKE